jgi:hypothetical protein
MKKILATAIAVFIALAAQATLYFYDGFNYTEDQQLKGTSTSNLWAGSGSPPQPTNRTGTLTYSGLPTATGGKVELAGYRVANAGSAARTLWDGTTGGLNGTNLFASLLLNVSSIGTCQSNTTSGNYVFSLRGGKGALIISNNANNAANFNIGLAGNGPGSGNIWDTNGGNGYSVNTTFLIVLSHTNSALNGTGGWSSRLWINPVLGETDPTTPGNLRSANFSVASGTNSTVIISNGNGNSDAAQRSMIYVDELRVGSTWADVTPIPEPATVGMVGLGALITLLVRRFRDR